MAESKMAEIKMEEFKMDPTIKLSQKEWVKFHFVQNGWIWHVSEFVRKN